ncbi:MAG: hypothetical protein A2735_03120 [Candidatus Yanofskybacteria bacterium RIFCSPHIGHO2_01_FULL_41_21]|uniref:GIY-YIG domain-containing protein n=1 Tax=Candidatus Yanofskybacteria bacterium RIFCSPHIGHO2_01_FULL_41_21 TaxID=1802660 RepID=A0A1F8E8W3_9BACT|nr:MAG: hypothetical protein A2735_03120 [Candidatus Yanofskybacteria bacterium RIFCSPHIGHO2_01_FULL_41_21]
MEPFKGPYVYSEKIIREWNSTAVGVYYIGAKTPENQLRIFYIGKAVSGGGIRKRLLEHLTENKWNDVTHFGFHIFKTDNIKEIEEFEKEEIAKYNPKHNIKGVY